MNIPYNIRWNFSWRHWLSKQEFIETEKTLNAAPCKLLNSNKSYILRFLKYFRTRRTYKTSYKHLPVEWRGADFLKQNYWNLWFFCDRLWTLIPGERGSVYTLILDFIWNIDFWICIFNDFTHTQWKIAKVYKVFRAAQNSRSWQLYHLYHVCQYGNGCR